MKREGLRAKILRVYAVQVLLIGLAILLGIYISNSIVQDVLMRSALDGEANHFWSLYEDNPDQALPNTDNLVGYLAHGTEDAGVPESIRYVGQTTGYHRGEFDGVFVCSDAPETVAPEENLRLLRQYFG